jgi:hypothetical protein
MSGAKPSMKASLKTLQIRKELLVAEAELLRAQLGHDLDVIQRGFSGLGEQAKSVASYASIITTVLAGISEFRRARKAGLGGKSSLVATLLTGIRTASSVWGMLRPRRE